MKVTYIILLFFVFGLLKSQYQIFGELYSELNEPLEDASIELKNEKGVLIGKAVSNEEGVFFLENIMTGDFIVSISADGFLDFFEKITVEDSDLDLERIIMKPSHYIDEVEFTGVKTVIKNKIDRKVVLVGTDLAQTGASLNDLMAIVPGVQVNNEETLLLRGNEVRVFINDRLTQQPYTELLRSIDPSNIDKIEVITNPSAKYAAEGMSGIVNIILKKNINKGFNASLGMDFDYDEYPWYFVKGSGNYNFGKVNIRAYSNYFDVKEHKGLTQDRKEVFYDTDRLFDYYLTNPEIGLDYFFDENNSVSADFQYKKFDIEVRANIDSLSKLSGANTRYSQFDRTKFNEYKTKLFYQRKFTKKGHRLDIEGLYQYDDDKEWINYDYNTFYKSSRLDKEHHTQLNIDYINPLTENTKLELGGEALWYNLKEDFTIRELDNDLDFKRNVFGLYGIYKREFKKVGIQLGLRTEFTDLRSITEEDVFKNNYVEFFPSTHLNYRLNGKNELQLSYSRRIERPSAYLYRPIRGEFSNYKLLGSNTLKPQLTDNIELNYLYQKDRWSLGLSFYYRFIKDEIGSNRYLDENDSNTIVFQRLNMGDKNEYGTEVTFNYSPFKWWSINSTWNIYHYKRQGFINNEFDEIRDNRLDGQLYSVFNITNDFKLSIDGTYNSSYDDFSGTFKNVSKVNLSLRKLLMDKKISFSLTMRDLFNTSIVEYEQERPLQSYDVYNVQNQMFTVSFRYNFSSGKQSNKIERKARKKNITEGVGQ